LSKKYWRIVIPGAWIYTPANAQTSNEFELVRD
jgi:hypothetical protein